MDKELRVKLYLDENDDYVEVWQLVGREKYIGRYTCGSQKEWVYLSDPLGYCEIDHFISHDVTIIVCDEYGNELFKTHNGEESSNFNTTKGEARERWADYLKRQHPKVKMENQSANFFRHWATGNPSGTFNYWLTSFQDPDQYPEAKDYAENWIGSYNEQVGSAETLAEYMFLGTVRKIERLHYRHRVCGVEWDNYYSDGFYMCAGFEESLVGPMYSQAEAEMHLIDAVKANFPEGTTVISYVELQRGYPKGEDGYAVQRNARISTACEHLLARNYRRAFVDQLVAEERKQSHFYKEGSDGITAIREKYPDCIEDHHCI